MSFVSSEYALLFAAVFVVYYLLKPLQLPILIVASLVFYSWGQEPFLPILLILSSLLASGITFAILYGRANRKTLLVAGVAINLAVLSFFKYKFLFFEPSVASPASGLFESLLLLPLPIGISFYTFHAISFIADAYKGLFREEGDKPSSLLSFLSKGLLYLVFFPQIVAGPIVKAHQFLPQIGVKHLSDIPFAAAARWIIWGLFFKLYVADNLGQFTVWMEFANNQRFGSFDLAFLLLCYSAQIFADFAGYSALAIGSAQLLGYSLPINFDRPYTASSFSDFWRRWHISLSSFLREYLYIPLGGNRKGPLRTYLNLMITMSLGGLWHGAAWSYLIWGFMHGLLLALERAALPWAGTLSPHWRSLGSRLYVPFVFAAVSILWLFFKLPNFSEALDYLGRMIALPTSRAFRPAEYAIALAYAAPVALWHLLPQGVRHGHGVLTAVIYAGMLFLAIFDGGQADAFIYFQF